MRFREIETKYNADKTPLTAFMSFCKEREPSKFVIAAGYDHFYEKVGDKESFCRHRIGPDANQITFKRKTTSENNYVRTEHNINLAKPMTEDQVRAYVEEFGYQYNTTLYKNCFVYKFDTYILVYYVVYDMDMKELGRFIEIEMDEDYPWVDDDEAWGTLLVMEKMCKSLGAKPESRITESLFEMYRHKQNE